MARQCIGSAFKLCGDLLDGDTSGMFMVCIHLIIDTMRFGCFASIIHLNTPQLNDTHVSHAGLKYI